eukprot:CAMPEP_0185311576 /NCGR_PEP_ID=MMETSP1363-20130426/27405_1 /TAXON_ID=38817 /ORGANISM="Gephyrocapsa oceanica, Strain RCC1303" /LENGTH=54 /DNA_ID=CAMNT_0027909265 /DNA_START=279 /DNA_END=443 /DNA_ORIENTATION=-
MPHGANSELATTTATANQPDGLTRTPSTALTTSPLSSISGERKICSGGSTSSAE